MLEYLESEFYVEAVQRGNLSGETVELARVVRDHELAHVEFLKSALGSAAREKPQFDFKDTTSDPDEFRATSVVLEDTSVAAHNGQGPRLREQTLAAAATIVSVEARHAAWIRRSSASPTTTAGLHPTAAHLARVGVQRVEGDLRSMHVKPGYDRHRGLL